MAASALVVMLNSTVNRFQKKKHSCWDRRGGKRNILFVTLVLLTVVDLNILRYDKLLKVLFLICVAMLLTWKVVEL